MPRSLSHTRKKKEDNSCLYEQVHDEYLVSHDSAYFQNTILSTIGLPFPVFYFRFHCRSLPVSLRRGSRELVRFDQQRTKRSRSSRLGDCDWSFSRHVSNPVCRSLRCRGQIELAMRKFDTVSEADHRFPSKRNAQRRQGVTFDPLLAQTTCSVACHHHNRFANKTHKSPVQL